MFHSFFNSIARSKYLSFFSLCFFPFYSVVIQDSKVHNFASFLFLLFITKRSILLAKNMWSMCITKSHRSFCVTFSKTDSGLCIYHLLVWSHLNFLHISQWFTLPTQSCLVLYSFCANLLHSLIMWLMVSSLSPHKLHLLFCGVLLMVFMTMFCAAIRRDSVSLLKLLFLSHVLVFSYDMLFISCLKRPESWFSSHFCFQVIVIRLVIVLSVLFLMAVISLLRAFLSSCRSLCRGVNAVFNAGKSSSSLLSWYI